MFCTNGVCKSQRNTYKEIWLKILAYLSQKISESVEIFEAAGLEGVLRRLGDFVEHRIVQRGANAERNHRRTFSGNG